MFRTILGDRGNGFTALVLCLAACPRASALPEHLGHHVQGSGRSSEQAESLLFQLQGTGGRGG